MSRRPSHQPNSVERRDFLKTALSLGAGLALPYGVPATRHAQADELEKPSSAELRPSYDGPNVIVVRFGGGVRRRETIEPETTYSPYFLRELVPRGVLFPQMEIRSEPGIETSHGQGTLNILTGIYDEYRDVEGKFLASRFEARVPTLFEYLRKAYDIAPHEALLVNGEDRTDEEFYSFSNHHLFGVGYRCSVLSLYRFKTYLLRREIERGTTRDDSGKQRPLADEEIAEKRKKLAELERLDYRRDVEQANERGQGAAIEAFWEQWRQHYGESGLVCPRGDRLLTELSLWAIERLRPRLMMINYNDPDYVHWGKPHHYTRGVSIIDQELKRLVDRIELDPFYRDNTLLVVVPDCGRDDNRFVHVPYQHHFNSKSSRQIFALLMGPGIDVGRIVDRPVQQIQLAATIGNAMGMPTEFAEGDVLAEVFA